MDFKLKIRGTHNNLSRNLELLNISRYVMSRNLDIYLQFQIFGHLIDLFVLNYLKL